MRWNLGLGLFLFLFLFFLLFEYLHRGTLTLVIADDSAGKRCFRHFKSLQKTLILEDQETTRLVVLTDPHTFGIWVLRTMCYIKHAYVINNSLGELTSRIFLFFCGMLSSAKWHIFWGKAKDVDERSAEYIYKSYNMFVL